MTFYQHNIFRWITLNKKYLEWSNGQMVYMVIESGLNGLII